VVLAIRSRSCEARDASNEAAWPATSVFGNHLLLSYESCSTFRFPEAFATSNEKIGIPASLGPGARRLCDPVQIILFRWRTGLHRQHRPSSMVCLSSVMFGIRRLPVHVDHPQPRMTGSPQCFLQEALGRNRVTRGAQEKVDRTPVASTARYKWSTCAATRHYLSSTLRDRFVFRSSGG
jgi:hypothetical protein